MKSGKSVTINNPLRKWWQRPLVISVAIFLVAFLVRVAGNTYSPPSPYWEETALGYDAYSILKTAHDHQGNFLPVVAFPSFGDYKPSLYFYTLVPSVAIFGLNIFAVRFPAVVFSALTVVVTFWLVKKWAGEKAAWCSALLLSFQPWNWQIGRVGFEVNLSVLLLMLGVYVLQLACEHFSDKQKKHFFLLSATAAISLALSMYAYHAARILAPLFAVAVLAWQLEWPKLIKKPIQFLPWFLSGIVAFILLLPLGLAITSPTVQQRFQETSVFTDPQPVLLSNQYKEQSGNSLLSKLIYHRDIFWARRLIENYSEHLSAPFLFGAGDQEPRHTSQFFGALYPWETVTLLLGIVFGVSYFARKKDLGLFVTLTLLAPLAATITLATPHALRALPLSVFLSIWSGLGAAWLITIAPLWLKQIHKIFGKIKFLNTGVALLFVGLVLGSWLILVFTYFGYYRIQYASSSWQYGYQQLYQKLDSLKQNNENIYVSREVGRPAMYLFFYDKIDPYRVQEAAKTVPKDQLEMLQFENWYFVTGANTEPGLHAAPPDVTPANAQILNSVNDLQNKTVWNIYRD